MLLNTKGRRGLAGEGLYEIGLGLGPSSKNRALEVLQSTGNDVVKRKFCPWTYFRGPAGPNKCNFGIME